jgi:hypothetical protein
MMYTSFIVLKTEIAGKGYSKHGKKRSGFGFLKV